MRSLIVCLGLMGCGATEPDKCVPAPTAAPPSVDQMRAAALPAKGTWRMVIAVDAQTPAPVFYGLYYGALTAGWRVKVAGAPTSGYPVDLAWNAVKTADFDFLVVPSDVPVRQLIQSFAHVAAVGAGARWLDEAGTLISPHQNQPFARMQAKQPGEIPALLHRMTLYAEDRLRVAHKATGGHPP